MASDHPLSSRSDESEPPDRCLRAPDVTIGMVLPFERQTMIDLSTQIAGCGVPVIFDLGQRLPRFDGANLLVFTEQAGWPAYGDCMVRLMERCTGKDHCSLAER